MDVKTALQIIGNKDLEKKLRDLEKKIAEAEEQIEIYREYIEGYKKEMKETLKPVAQLAEVATEDKPPKEKPQKEHPRPNSQGALICKMFSRGQSLTMAELREKADEMGVKQSNLAPTLRQFSCFTKIGKGRDTKYSYTPPQK